MKLDYAGLADKNQWLSAGISPPGFDIPGMIDATAKAPRWVHFGAGNIFRCYIAALSQKLLEKGKTDTGIVAAESYDPEIVTRIYRPHDNLALRVVMNIEGTYDKKVIASVSESLESGSPEGWSRLNEIFKFPGLQIVSFTVTEKGYNLYKPDGTYLPEVSEDISGRLPPKHLISQITALLLARFSHGRHPIALVSMDNCSRNGEKLRDAVLTIAREWAKNGLAGEDFLSYLSDEKLVSFPWTMIDKITPRPSPSVAMELRKSGFESVNIIETSKHTFIAPFVNTEKAEYLVMEDSFPNGRPPLEYAGVMLTDRENVEKAERMKVSTCLNPLHTALAVFGCLLGYGRISDEMKDPYLPGLVRKIGYEEGMPVVTDPGIINPARFIDEVINERLPNPNIPDTPQRIASDTSQKVSVRYGETIKAYIRLKGSASGLIYIPLAIAGWLRYLMGVDDEGNEMPPSPDPLLGELKAHLSGSVLGSPKPESIRPLLSNKVIFGVNLYVAGLGEKIEGYFAELSSGKGAVKNTLRKYLSEC